MYNISLIVISDLYIQYSKNLFFFKSLLARAITKCAKELVRSTLKFSDRKLKKALKKIRLCIS